jgi:hypothetical protein
MITPYLFRFTVTALAMALSFAPSTTAKEPQTGLPKLTLSAGGHSIRVDVAATDDTRQKGLMFRTKMAPNEGMLFVFEQVGYHAMWMRNTPLPLTVAFIDDKGAVVSLHDMEPFNETVTHQATGPVRYALEMNLGWFAKHRVKVGDTVKGLDKAPKPK